MAPCNNHQNHDTFDLIGKFNAAHLHVNSLYGRVGMRMPCSARYIDSDLLLLVGLDEVISPCAHATIGHDYPQGECTCMILGGVSYTMR